MSEKKAITAAELLAKLQNDPDYVERRREQDQALEHRRRFRAQAEKPLVTELRRCGLQVDSVWDLVERREPYPEAIPILLEHLEREYPAKIREGLGRALAVPVLEPQDWLILVTAFSRETDEEAKWALALAVEKNAHEEHVDQLLDLLRDPRSGKGRVVFAEALHRLRDDQETIAALRPLATDPQVGESIRRLLETGSTVIT